MDSEGEMAHSADSHQNGTGFKLEQFLKDLELEQHYPQKLSMSTLLQIDSKAITDEPVKSNTDVVWYFLKKLMMANVTARNVKCESLSSRSNTVLNLDNLLACSKSDMLNPLDVITALFLCSDGFVQQELALKMSMCQFAVPLLLPNYDTKKCTLMLWAMRDIVKKYRPQSLSESKGFKEESIVLSEIPMVSFVRLGECSLSKSETLNKLLSNSQQYHDTFVHRNMECGDCPRTISNGLAEMTWYLPCGKTNIDIFSEPVAVANLRGDIASFETQYSFLCQTSSAVFVFFDNFNLDFSLLTKTNQKEKIYLVVDQRNQHFNLNSLKTIASRLGLTNSRVLIKTKAINDADFVTGLRETVSNVVENTTTKMPLVKMGDVALDLGICVDEYNTECQKAKENAYAITKDVHDILRYKETQLPLQGQIWKELTTLEKEEFRLRKVESEGIEKYKCKLQSKREQLRIKQNSHEMSNAIICFIAALTSEKERRYFLKWMRIYLDNLSREKLSGLREQYKSKCNDSRNKEEIKEIDRQLSCSSLGTEHYFREMGQIYEASVSLPESHSRQQLQHLPRLCAQLMLDGFPLELVDGDASNIPLKWVSDVLAQLHELVSPKNKILVVTVLGVQSTGKSTLLNTMFGVQFAVSSGRCTRGAFMLLIRVSEDLKQTLNCDFLVIIDTEGLKSPELAQLDDSYEHDNELATLVVGLSDITLVNIAMENAIEMKDILQIVVHAFLRMKEVGKKPKCQFVHQNVSDVSAHEKNLRDRKLLLRQLDEMTQAAAKMEKKEKYKSFTDVMEYNPDTGNWYIPGLWNGNPPMAPVNAGYSEAVYELKKNILEILEKCESSAKNIQDFQGWMTSLWNAVKHENFIFSFRNSLVADAYMKLCTEFNKWEWDFKKAMYKWVTKNETRIKNFGTIAAKEHFSDINELLTHLKTDACTELSNWEETLLGNLTQYFKQKEGHVYLVEGYKQEFKNSAKSLRRDIESSVMNQLTAATEIKQGLTEVERIKKKHTEKIEDRVCKLIENCSKKRARMSDQELDKEFDNMWNKTVKELDCYEQRVQDVFASVNYHLRKNLQDKGSHACEALDNKKLEDCGTVPFKYSPDGLLKQFKHQVCKLFRIEDHVKEAQVLADELIDACEQHATKKATERNNYHNTHILEILQIIDAGLNRKDINDMDFEVSLKQHICAVAARRFQKLHLDFLSANDPYLCLNKNKEKFCADFKDLFHERDQCQKKAEEFTDRCLRPAVEDFVQRSLGPDIIGEMHTCQEFRTRIFFQYTLLLDLLNKDDFNEYLKYICSYENYVKDWILDRILKHFSNSSAISEFENKHVQSCICSINEAIISIKNARSATVTDFVEQVCKELGDKLHISPDALGAFMILNNANQEQFAYWLTKCVNEMAQSFQMKLVIPGTQMTPKSFHMEAQNELFKEMKGCGKQCPFCNVPCDAGGGGHSLHWASLHRSQALGGRSWFISDELVTDICSTAVGSETAFISSATKGKWHPFKNYSEIYSDWKIDADVSLEASDYWKYVLTKFNKDFAKEFNAEPADIPEKWERITQKQAEKSLKESFNIK